MRSKNDLTPQDIAMLLEALDLVVRTHGLQAAQNALGLAVKLQVMQKQERGDDGPVGR